MFVGGVFLFLYGYYLLYCLYSLILIMKGVKYIICIDMLFEIWW